MVLGRGSVGNNRKTDIRLISAPLLHATNSVPSTANVPHTPHRAPANLAFGGSGHTDTTNPCPARSASVGDLRGHAVWLMKRRGRHGLRRRCDGYGKGGSSDQPDHLFSPMLSP